MLRLALATVALALLLPATAPAAEVVESIGVTFAVENVNRTTLPCNSDGKPYRIAGRIVGPQSVLEGGRPVDVGTLYLHEYSFGSWFWTFDDVPGLNHAAEMARAGHVSVVIDRLGYDGSDHPPGLDTCLGAQADIARQIIERLKAGDYASGGSSPRFARIVLAGHSVGAVAAELAVTSFGDALGVDGLVVLALANQGYTPGALQESFVQGGVCTTGGEPAEEGQPTGYAYYAQTPEDWKPLVFASASPAVQEAAVARRNRDPCGDVSTLTPASGHNAAQQSSITLPVLVLFGGSDAVYEPGTGEKEAAAFSGSDDVTYREFPDTGHALLLEAAAPDVRGTIAEWLTARGMAPKPRGGGSGNSGGGTGGGGSPPAAAPRSRASLVLSRRRCVRRAVVLRARGTGRLTVRVDGRGVRPLRRRGLLRIRLGRRATRDGRVVVTAVLRTSDGGTFRVARRYRTCAG